MSLEKIDSSPTKNKEKWSFGRRAKKRALMRALRKERDALRQKEQIQGLSEVEKARLEVFDDYYD